MATRSEIRRLLRGRPEGAADAAQELFGSLLDRLGASVPGAVVGLEPDVGAYVSAYHSLLHEMLRLIHEADPNLVVLDADLPVLVDAGGEPSAVSLEVLEQGALQAPFSPWVEKFGPGPGVALYLASEIRKFLPGHQPLHLPREWAVFPHAGVSQHQFIRFARKVWSQLEERRQPQLETIMDSFAVSKTELARLFGVRRQAVDQWLEGGIPVGRQEKVASVLAISDLLTTKLKPGRVPGAVRRPSGAFGGRSILDYISSDRHLDVLDSLRKTFDWAATA